MTLKQKAQLLRRGQQVVTDQQQARFSRLLILLQKLQLQQKKLQLQQKQEAVETEEETEAETPQLGPVQVTSVSAITSTKVLSIIELNLFQFLLKFFN